jgi:hypothetical protein
MGLLNNRDFDLSAFDGPFGPVLFRSPLQDQSQQPGNADVTARLSNDVGGLTTQDKAQTPLPVNADAQPFSDNGARENALADARAELAKRLSAGNFNNDEGFRTYAFHLNLPPADITTAGLQGLSLGFRDEATAAGRALADAVPGESFSEAYPFFLAAERERYNKFKKDHPTEASLAEEAGAATTSFLGSKIPFVGPAFGVLSDAIRGAGEADGDLADRLQGAEQGAINGIFSGGGKELAKGAFKALGRPTFPPFSFGRPLSPVEQIIRDQAR